MSNKLSRRSLLAAGSSIVTIAAADSTSLSAHPKVTRHIHRHLARGHNVHPLTPSAKVANLNTLYGTSGQAVGITPWASLFALMNLHVENDFLGAVGHAQAQPDQTLPWQPFAGSNNIIVNLKTFSYLENTTTFRGTAALNFATFVELDKYTAWVPWHVAQLYASAFLAGFLTRTCLQKYVAVVPSILPGGKLFLNPTIPPGPNPPPPTTTAGSFIAKYLGNVNNTMNATNTWNAPYGDVLAANFDGELQLAGMLDGWLLADALDATASSDLTMCKTAIMALINARYTIEHVGLTVGYCLFYLSGYLNSDRTNQFLSGVTMSGPLNGTSNVGGIFAKLQPHLEGIANAKRDKSGRRIFELPNKFFDVVMGDYEGLALKGGARSNPDLQSYTDFLRGYEAGMSRGATALFKVMYQQGWEDGYDQAYTAGYSAGYTTGFNDGYGTGYASGWQAGYDAIPPSTPSWIGNLGDIVSTIGKNISDVNTVIGQITAVGSAIASFF